MKATWHLEQYRSIWHKVTLTLWALLQYIVTYVYINTLTSIVAYCEL